MYKLDKVILISVILIVACKPAFKTNPEICILKKYYSHSSECIPVYLDSIQDIISLGNKSDSLCKIYYENCFIGLAYNLHDSSFVPAKDTSYNIIVPCGIGHPSHGKYHMSEYSTLITGIDKDSIDIFDKKDDFRTRLHINNFKEYFKKYLINNKIKNLASDEYVLIAIDISNNPPKELFKKIFRIAFWTYYSDNFSKYINNPKGNLEQIIQKSESDPDVIRFMMAPLYIRLIRDSRNIDFRYKVLTPWK
jgi:hypothetical protein